MIHPDRQAIWQRICREVARFDDGTGNEVDSGIFSLVVALRAHGSPTFASCEGHLEWGCGQPWVDIRLPGVTRVGEETDNSYSVVWPQEHRHTLALLGLLDALYEERSSVPHHARLVVHRLGSPGWLHISTGAHQAGFELRGQERLRWLRQGLYEAQSFASCLNAEFLRNGSMVGAEPVLE